MSILKDKNVGIIVNHTSVNSKGKHIIDIMIDKKINIMRIFAPEHGYLGNRSAGEEIENDVDSLSGIEIVSLYGKNKSPQDQYLTDLDVLIFDIQDIGVRYYTYISTMTLAMESATKNNVKFLVLDRPNPLSGSIVEGPVLNADFSSFVGMHSIPVRHGMTTGEIALFIKQNNLIENADELDLEILRMENWNREKWYYNRCGKWIPPSPNIPNVNTALMYSGTCLLEGTNVSEGRGTDTPFMVFGAPWLDNKKLIKNLQSYKFKGIQFSEYDFTPISIQGKADNPKYKGIQCKGVKIRIYNRKRFNSFIVGMIIINEIYKTHLDVFEFKDDFFDKLYGSDILRTSIIDSKNLDNIINEIEIELGEFMIKRNKALLY